MKNILLILLAMAYLNNYGQNLLLHQPYLNDVLEYEQEVGGIKTEITSPSFVNADSYPYIDLYKIKEPLVFLTELNQLNLIKSYYAVANDSVVRYTNYNWDLFPPNTNEEEKHKLLTSDKMAVEDYFLIFDTLAERISTQLSEKPSTINKQDTIYNEDGSVNSQYKCSYWTRPDQVLKIFCTYSDTIRNIRLDMYWLNDEVVDWLKEEGARLKERDIHYNTKK